MKVLRLESRLKESLMASSRFDSPEASIDYMKRVAVKKSGFSNRLNVEPLKVWEGESELLLELRAEMTQHHGFAHGAIVGLMADKACAWAGPLWSAMWSRAAIRSISCGPRKATGCAPRASRSGRGNDRLACSVTSTPKAMAQSWSTCPPRKRPSSRPASKPRQANERLIASLEMGEGSPC